MKKIKTTDRNYWVWCTRKEYYLDEDGDEIFEGIKFGDIESRVEDSWWSCHVDTKKGDFAFLWRLNPKQDIGYLFQAETDAYILVDEETGEQADWKYACEYRLIYKFESPLKRIDLEMNPYLSEWSALRGNFQRLAYKIPDDIWLELNKYLKLSHPAYKKIIEKLENQPKDFILKEEQLEDFLYANIHYLNKFGYKLFIYRDKENNISGRQVICQKNGGRIDLLCFDKKRDAFVVIELKITKATQNSISQIMNYMGWVQDYIAEGKKVYGLIISPGFDIKFQSALKTQDKIKQINIEDLNLPIELKRKK